MTPLAEEKNLDLKIDVSQAPSTLMVDVLRLQQLVTNLVSNAIRYTESGSVQVNCRQVDDQSWAISVTDTGIGIEKEEQSRIFDPYVRSNTQTKLVAGTGLGLAIAQRIVTLMQGKIAVVSEAGKGSTFTVVLPLVEPNG